MDDSPDYACGADGVNCEVQADGAPPATVRRGSGPRGSGSGSSGGSRQGDGAIIAPPPTGGVSRSGSAGSGCSGRPDHGWPRISNGSPHDGSSHGRPSTEYGRPRSSSQNGRPRPSSGTRSPAPAISSGRISSMGNNTLAAGTASIAPAESLRSSLGDSFSIASVGAATAPSFSRTAMPGGMHGSFVVAASRLGLTIGASTASTATAATAATLMTTTGTEDEEYGVEDEFDEYDSSLGGPGSFPDAIQSGTGVAMMASEEAKDEPQGRPSWPRIASPTSELHPPLSRYDDLTDDLLRLAPPTIAAGAAPDRASMKHPSGGNGGSWSAGALSHQGSARKSGSGGGSGASAVGGGDGSRHGPLLPDRLLRQFQYGRFSMNGGATSAAAPPPSERRPAAAKAWGEEAAAPAAPQWPSITRKVISDGGEGDDEDENVAAVSTGLSWAPLPAGVRTAQVGGRWATQAERPDMDGAERGRAVQWPSLQRPGTAAVVSLGDSVVGFGQGEWADEAPAHRQSSPGWMPSSATAGGAGARHGDDDALRRRAVAIATMIKGAPMMAGRQQAQQVGGTQGAAPPLPSAPGGGGAPSEPQQLGPSTAGTAGQMAVKRRAGMSPLSQPLRMSMLGDSGAAPPLDK